MKKNRLNISKFVRFVVLTAVLLASVIGTGIIEAESKPSQEGLVYIIPVEQTIETGLQEFLERSFEEAESAGATSIVLVIDTLGGGVGAALAIGDIINNSPLHTIAFIQGKAISAGSYIALNADEIYMAPGSTIGAAAVVNISGERVHDSKTIAVWSSHMRSAADMNDRNPEYAEGMVNDQKVVEVKEIGRTFAQNELISFSAKEAVAAGYAEGEAKTIQDVLQQSGLSAAPTVQVELSPSEKLARVLTHPVVMTLLLLIGLAGVAIELFVPGFGFPGILGVAAFGLYFFGHYAAGFAGIEHIFMFVAGIVLLAIEIFVPSFGILGILGILSLISGVLLAAYDTGQASLSLGIAFVIAIIVVAIVVRLFKHKGIWNKFILKDALNKEAGYISSEDKAHLLGKTGISLTSLRPSGTALIDDNRVDVVSSGEYIEQNKTIKVIHIEGTRVVVREQ